MSLDVYLIEAGLTDTVGSGIYVREDGQTKELTEKQWKERHPGKRPYRLQMGERSGVVFTMNITHNLSQMAEMAGLYEPLWEPSVLGIKEARGLIEPLSRGLTRLRSTPEIFKEYEPRNRWGTYNGLVKFTQAYLEAAIKHPDAQISVSR